jgi:hypothetical protein
MDGLLGKLHTEYQMFNQGILSRSIAAIGLSVAAMSVAHAAPISGSAAFTGFANPGGSVLTCTATPCTVANWTGLDFANTSPNAGYGNTTGSFLSIMGASGTGTFSDTSFSMPGQLFTAGGVTFTWTSVSKSYDGATWGAVFDGTATAQGYDATKMKLTFSSQSNGSSWSAETIPVPGTIALLGLGLAGLGLIRTRRA